MCEKSSPRTEPKKAPEDAQPFPKTPSVSESEADRSSVPSRQSDSEPTADHHEVNALISRLNNLMEELSKLIMDKNPMAAFQTFERLEITLLDLQAAPKELTAKLNGNHSIGEHYKTFSLVFLSAAPSLLHLRPAQVIYLPQPGKDQRIVSVANGFRDSLHTT